MGLALPTLALAPPVYKVDNLNKTYLFFTPIVKMHYDSMSRFAFFLLYTYIDTAAILLHNYEKKSTLNTVITYSQYIAYNQEPFKRGESLLIWEEE